MIPEVGTLLLALSALACLLAVRQPTRAAKLCFACLSAALTLLIYARVVDDFTVHNVAMHSHSAMPVLYKISGTWGNHEGSMLLWVWVMGAFSALLSTRPVHAQAERLIPIAQRIQLMVIMWFVVFVLATSNPFAAVTGYIVGQELNPLLQDIGLAMHPPMLYLGYVGFSLVFSLAIAALLTRTPPQTFAEIIHPWIMGAWSALTFGIGLGSWWAYRELGWGGFWFWDPVENASLLPWLAGTALLHSNLVLKKNGQLYAWVLLLSILTFAMSLLGTFLVRSGAITSVHSFASDPARGLFILALIGASVGGALLVFALRAPAKTEGGIVFLSKPGAILINNLFMLVICGTVLLGTLYPLIAELLWNDKVTVGPPFYHKTITPLVVIPLLIAALAPLIGWNGVAANQLNRLWPWMVGALLLGGAIAAFVGMHPLLAALGFGLAAWLAAGSTAYAIRHNTINAVVLAHIGVALFLAGVTGEGLWAQHAEKIMQKGEQLTLADVTFTYKDEGLGKASNHIFKRAEVDVDGRVLTPEFRYYPTSGITTSEAAIASNMWRDIYVVIGETAQGGGTAMRVYIKPCVNWIWAGCLLMSLAGFLSLRRKR